MFTKQHYVKVAVLIYGFRGYLYQQAPNMPVGTEIERLALGLARMFEEDNPRFNKAKFMWACGFSNYEEPCTS